ncbi:hypothetical protein CsSME_00013866 [Camellia sinensis var. sinensis]
MRSGQTISKHFNNVLKAVLRLHGLLLKKLEPITANCTDDKWSCFQNCLGALDGTYVKTQFRIITACCLLHNLIQCEMPMDLDDDENEEMNPPPPATELGDEMIDVVEASDQWSEWRTAMATQMFNEWKASRGQ